MNKDKHETAGSGGNTSKSLYASLDNMAKKTFGETGFASLSEDEMDTLIDLKAANKIAKKDFGEFGFASLSPDEQKSVITSNPKLVRSGMKNKKAGSKNKTTAVLNSAFKPFKVVDSKNDHAILKHGNMTFAFDANKHNLKDPNTTKALVSIKKNMKDTMSFVNSPGGKIPQDLREFMQRTYGNLSSASTRVVWDVLTNVLRSNGKMSVNESGMNLTSMVPINEAGYFDKIVAATKKAKTVNPNVGVTVKKGKFNIVDTVMHTNGSSKTKTIDAGLTPDEAVSKLLHYAKRPYKV